MRKTIILVLLKPLFFLDLQTQFQPQARWTGKTENTKVKKKKDEFNNTDKIEPY